MLSMGSFLYINIVYHLSNLNFFVRYLLYISKHFNYGLRVFINAPVYNSYMRTPNIEIQRAIIYRIFCGLYKEKYTIVINVISIR